MGSCFQSKQRKVDKIREEEDRQKRIAEREKKQEEEARKRRQVRLDDVTLKYNVFSSQFFSYFCEWCCRSESACARSDVAIAVAVELRRRDDDNTPQLHSIEDFCRRRTHLLRTSRVCFSNQSWTSLLSRRCRRDIRNTSPHLTQPHLARVESGLKSWQFSFVVLTS